MFAIDLLDHMQKLYFLDEEITVIFAPHIDDVFLSLGETIKSGELGENIVSVNMFNMSASSKNIKIRKRNFENIAKTSKERMLEEFQFSKHLESYKINYLPFFWGIRDIRLQGLGTYLEGYSDEKVKKHFQEKNLKFAINAFLNQLNPKKIKILFPTGLSENMDHKILGKGATEVGAYPKVGVFADIPYISTFDSVEQIRKNIPRQFSKVYIKRFKAKEKMAEFNSIYDSQINPEFEPKISKIAKNMGEIIFWKA
ncbi:MAG: PIG-L family deacetylase [Candidatus Micrarchaeota archaeon]|nr:PIG-L family deacetylase [Candidatus Micrarchaeota archaeon]